MIASRTGAGRPAQPVSARPTQKTANRIRFVMACLARSAPPQRAREPPTAPLRAVVFSLRENGETNRKQDGTTALGRAQGRVAGIAPVRSGSSASSPVRNRANASSRGRACIHAEKRLGHCAAARCRYLNRCRRGTAPQSSFRIVRRRPDNPPVRWIPTWVATLENPRNSRTGSRTAASPCLLMIDNHDHHANHRVTSAHRSAAGSPAAIR